MVKKLAIPGETVASYARRIGKVDNFARRGAEVRGPNGWKKVGMDYRIAPDEIVRTVQPVQITEDPLGLVEFLRMLARRQK
jgi:hypothetical protein